MDELFINEIKFRRKRYKIKVTEHDDVLGIITITDADTTMGEVEDILDAINEAGEHVVFDVSALDAGMYLCTIYLNNGSYRISDMVTGYVGTGLYSDTNLLKTLIENSTSTGLHYTVRWDKTNAQMDRFGDAQYITTTTTHFAHHGTVDSSYSNPFDSIYPWSGRKLCNIDIATYMALSEGDDLTLCVKAWEGEADFSYSDANGVWVYTPQFYGQHYSIGNYEFFDVSNEKTPNNITFPAMITGRWHGVKATLTIGGTSKSVLLPKQGIPCVREALSTIHTYAKNYGGSLTSIYELDASALLFLVEYANFNSQSAIGDGVSGLYRESSDKIKAAATASTTVQVEYSATIAGLVIPGAIFDIGTANGGNQVGSYIVQSAAQDETDNTKLNVVLNEAVTVTTDYFWSVHGLANTADSSIGSHSGYIGTSGKCNAYYRGEVLWGNMFQYVLGAYHQATTNHLWVAEDADAADDYDAIDTSHHIDTGITLAASNDYVKSLGFYDAKFAVGIFCTAVGSGAGSSNPVGDYYYVSIDSNTILLAGGAATYGSYDGLFFGRWYISAGYSAWSCGGRPRLKSP